MYWTEERIARLRKVYPRGTKTEILTLFRGRTWEAIKLQASRNNIKRLSQSRKREEYPLMDNTTRCIMAWSIAWEGSIALHKQMDDTKNRIYGLDPIVSVGNTNKKMLEELIHMSGYGHIGDTPYQSTPNCKPVYKWEIRSIPEANAFLKQVFPHLPSKRKQAELLLEFTKSRLKRWRMPYTKREVEIQQEIEGLNRRGIE